jgi:plastocyanin
MTSSSLLRSAAAAGVLVLGLGACGGDDDDGGAAPTVPGATGAVTDKIEVKDFKFNPETTSVRAGTTVTWTFADDVDHNVEPVDPSSELKKGPDLQGGATYGFKFTKAGTVAYRCGIHEQMTGSVVVTA